MTLTTHPNSVPDALVATLPAGTEAIPSPVEHHVVDALPTADADTDRLGRGCHTCADGTYLAGPGAGHVTCDACGHATIRKGRIGRPRRRS